MNTEEHFNNLLTLQLNEAVDYLICFRQEIKNFRIVFFTSKGTNIPKEFNSITSNGVSMLSLSPKESFLVIDDRILHDIENNKYKSDIYVKGCVHFDTQIISYLLQIYDDSEKTKEIYDTYLFLNNILINKFDFTNDLYLIENGYKIDDLKIHYKLAENLLAYNHYKKSDPKSFENDFGKNIIYNEDDKCFCQKSLEGIERINTKHFVFYDFYNLTYCLLLKLACIDFTSKKSSKNKFLELCDFINNSLGLFLEREVAISYLYLIKDDGVSIFFRKFKRNANDLLGVIKGMSWDLTHIRIIEWFMFQDQIESNFFTNHYLVTYDKGLRDVLLAYPLERIVFYNGEYRERFKFNLSELAKDVDFNEVFINTKDKREITRKNSNIEKVKKRLENELIKIISPFNV